MGNAETAGIAVYDPNDRWTQARLDLIKRTICHPDMTEPEIALFLEQCKRTGADPMIKQAFCVPRTKKVKLKKSGPHGAYTEDVDQTTYEFQMSEEGMASRCAEFPDYRGIKFAAFFEKDKFVVDFMTGEVSHVAEPGKDRGALKGAWAVVLREGFTFSPEILYVEEYEVRIKGGQYQGQLTSQWQKRVTMIVKCARAAARRRAYSKQFAGIFASEELQRDLENETLRRAEGDEPQRSTGLPRADAMRAKITDKLKSLGGTTSTAAPTIEDADFTPEQKAAFEDAKVKARAHDEANARKAEVKEALQTITNSDVDRAGPPPVDDEKKPAPPSPSAGAKQSTAASDDPALVKLNFGPPNIRGKQVGQLDTDTLIAACGLAEEQIAQAKGTEGWLAATKKGLEACEKVLKARELEQ